MIATANRVLRQLRHDPRTLAMIFVVPCALLTLLWWVYDGAPVFQSIAPALLALFPLLIMFLVTSIATLRERTSGTLERLLTLPVSKVGFLGGYAIAFGVLAAGQAVFASLLLVGPLGLDLAGPWGLLVLVAVLDALLGMSLGLFVSAFARSEFQAVQFMPAVVLPQFLLCGLLVPRDQMPEVLEWVSRALPLTYAVDAMTRVSTQPVPEIWGDVAVICAFVIGFLGLGAVTLKRRSA
ncbi:ABC-2 type transport system permease protein [Sanguibacter gelidistatuariae]|uniref:Transport permease protein n=1 Tax=Sanguibacter gelidistatuariae TaxID=1814289 RepID=A0A1G6Y2N7_9MICO|nr:ABC transporter permease [Sanguibacter gelidistatuariae]SDD83875.1 ABC-2 type transport system permease protein [Sanguibacter gelidistatuariae]